MAHLFIKERRVEGAPPLYVILCRLYQDDDEHSARGRLLLMYVIIAGAMHGRLILAITILMVVNPRR